MFRRFVTVLLTLAMVLPVPAAQAVGSRYSDVPPDDWSVGAIEKATEYGIFHGYEDGTFGFHNTMSRAHFVTALGRIFGWADVTPETPTFIDCAPGTWYYTAVETAWANGILAPNTVFNPNDDISRRDMSVMLMKAMDYDQLAALEADAELPFPDVESDRGYIALAYRFGIINGVEQDGQLWFFPNKSAPREQVAALLVRAYEKLHARIDWLHGFYALSSYGQIGLTDAMDAVSVGWALMDVDPETGPFLNQSAANGNSWSVPPQSNLATDYFQGNGTPYNLCVYAGPTKLTLPDGTASNNLYGILERPEHRTQAVAALAAAVDGYAGLTIDFEGIKAPLKEAFVAFMTELRAALPQEKSLLVCVQAPEWYDGFDYRALGELCNKVILMAHDYQWTSVPADYVGSTNTNTPVTPFNSVYAALKAVTDPDTGVQDKAKLALAISIAGVGLQVDEAGTLLSDTLYTPGPSTIIGRLRQEDSQRGWSDTYRNPYLYYTTEDGSRYRLWYEDARSVMEKVQLARMLGVGGVSLWRIGTIPNYPDEGLDYNVWSALLSRR